MVLKCMLYSQVPETLIGLKPIRGASEGPIDQFPDPISNPSAHLPLPFSVHVQTVSLIPRGSPL